MDSTTLVTGLLTEDIIEGGAELVRYLDQAELSVKAALWYYEPELDTWRLVLGIDEVDREGPREIYKTVDKALWHVGLADLGVRLADVNVASPRQQLIRVLRKYLKTGKRITRSRIRRNTIGGQYIEEALIYRLW